MAENNLACRRSAPIKNPSGSRAVNGLYLAEMGRGNFRGIKQLHLLRMFGWAWRSYKSGGINCILCLQKVSHPESLGFLSKGDQVAGEGKGTCLL